ncbi:MAG: sigma-54-dependent Fis family transcriptional regulator [Lentisphaerae bacterium]|nr:sigma-54-dependent Fis family transcriptional regulator [Lentisphaerota bacterium]
MENARILVVEDDPDGRRSLVEAVADTGATVHAAATGDEGVRLFREKGADVVISDLVLPDRDGLSVLEEIARVDRRIPVLIITAYGSVETAVRAMRSGAYDYITKPLDLDELQAKLARAVETSRLRSKVDELQESMRLRYTASAMVAQSPAMREVLRQIEALAATNATVFISGESGTGKELVARALHVDGIRANGPFIAVNCGAFAESLLESELFGHEKGSFTGAVRQHKGAFERADGGTLFLDEIGDAPKSVQVKLLRVLEEREIVRVGGQESFRVDVRLISASNRDLEAMVKAGEFREDLMYRLKVVSLHVPPLRERREDIRPLADRFIAAACEEHGRHVESVAPSFYEKLEAFDWPGNVRQLRNVVEAAVIMSPSPGLDAGSIRFAGKPNASVAGETLTTPENMTFADIEREVLVQTLRRLGGNRTLTAEKLGLSRRTVQRKIQEYGLPY